MNDILNKIAKSFPANSQPFLAYGVELEWRVIPETGQGRVTYVHPPEGLLFESEEHGKAFIEELFKEVTGNQ
jgi:hypothetical protein